MRHTPNLSYVASSDRVASCGRVDATTTSGAVCAVSVVTQQVSSFDLSVIAGLTEVLDIKLKPGSIAIMVRAAASQLEVNHADRCPRRW